MSREGAASARRFAVAMPQLHCQTAIADNKVLSPPGRLCGGCQWKITPAVRDNVFTQRDS
jgi:hypothetical protein